MSEELIRDMLSDIVNELDYDLWKSMFNENCIEDPEDNEDLLKRLVSIVHGHLGNAKDES